jgi:anti-sigma-K factor RskA
VSGDSGQNLNELAAAYALGALEPEEARAFEAYLATSPEAQREVAEYREVGALLAVGAAGSAAPAKELRGRVVTHATREKVIPIRSQRPWAPWAALAASLIAVAGLGLGQRSLRQQLAARDSTIASLQQTLDAREAKLASREAELNAILDPNVSLTRMGTPGTPQPVVQLFWNRRSNLILAHAFQLPPVAARRAYQLWFIPKNGQPIPSVTFNTEPDGHGLVQQIPVPQDVELTAAAITEEPEGGSPQPTSPIVVVGTFAPAKS